MILFFLISLSWILFSIVFYSWKYGISPTPSSRQAKRQILRLIPEGKETIVELGSGWGTLAFALARQCPLAKIEAYEISSIPYLVSKGIQRMLCYSNLNIHKQDFFQVSLESASVVVCYLYPGAMKKLKTKFEKELAKGTLVISHTFAVPGWSPQAVFYLNDLYQNPIYLYQI